MQGHSVDLRLEHELLHLWHVPGPGLVRMLVDEVSLALDLYAIDLQAEPDMGFPPV